MNIDPEEIKEILSTVYDDYVDRDEFPLDMSSVEVFLKIEDVYIIKAVGSHPFSYLNSNVSNNGYFVFNIFQPVYAGNILGSYHFAHHYWIEEYSREGLKKSFRKMFDDFFESKQGIGGAIIEAASIRMINLQEKYGVSLSKYDGKTNRKFHISSSPSSLQDKHVAFYYRTRSTLFPGGSKIEHIIDPTPEFLAVYASGKDFLA